MSKSTNKRLGFPPEVIFKAHVYHPVFIRDCGNFDQKMRSIESQNLSDQERNIQIDKLFKEFREIYPSWPGAIPDENVLKGFREFPGDHWVFFLERNKLDPVVVIKNRNMFNELLDKSNNLFDINNKMLLQIDMFAKSEDIILAVEKEVRRYKTLLFGVNGRSKKSRNRKEDIIHLKNFWIKYEAVREKISPATKANPEKFKKKTKTNKHEWDEKLREIRRSCSRARLIFQQLGLPEIK